MPRRTYGLGALFIILFLLCTGTFGIAEEAQKDAFAFAYTFELSEDGACHVIVKETITFNEHYFGNPELLAEVEADKIDVDGSGGSFLYGASSSGSGSGGQKFQTGGKYSLIEYLHFLELLQYNPHNFRATDPLSGERLEVVERTSGAYRDFVIKIGDCMGSPEKGDEYSLIMEYDTENRVEVLGSGRYAFSFYRKGWEESGLNQYEITIVLPPYYEYENSRISEPSRVFQSRVYANVFYRGEHFSDELFEFRMQYHIPVAIMVEEGQSLMEKGLYSEAKSKFEEASKRYRNLGKQSELSAVNSLITYCDNMTEMEEWLTTAKTNLAARDFEVAMQQFQEVLSDYGQFLTENQIKECNQYIGICEDFLRGEQLERQAEADVEAQRWDSAIANLEEAKRVYSEVGDSDRARWIEERMAEVRSKSLEEKSSSQLRTFVIGSFIIIGGIVFAFYGYNAFRGPAKPTETIDVGALLESPDIPEDVKQFLEEKIGWRAAEEKFFMEDNVKITEKLRRGRDTLQKMLKDDKISEKEYSIAMEEIKRKIELLMNGKDQKSDF